MTKKKMTIRQYDDMIRKHVDRKDYVKIYRTVTDGSADIRGFILELSKEFLLIQQEEEFYLNGYAIIRKDDFDSIRCNKYDRSFKRILKGEGIFDKDYGIENKVELKDWKTIFEGLKKLNHHVIVECEHLKESSFVIGPIKKINRNSVGIQYYSPTGLLDKKPTTVKFEDITLVKFDDRYINVFKKYLRTN